MYYIFLKDFQEYGDILEISFNRKCVTKNVPIQVGFAVLQYAKLRILEIIALTSKTYILDTDLGKYKTAANGAQKNINSLTREEYKKALFENVKITGKTKVLECLMEKCPHTNKIKLYSLMNIQRDL